MIALDATAVTEHLPALRSELASAGSAEHPTRAVIDSRETTDGDLFFGLPGERVDGGSFAAELVQRGVWGVVVTEQHFEAAVTAAAGRANVYAVADPALALAALARAWRRALGAQVIGVTGSTGKTTTKDILAALLSAEQTVVATPENHNNEIGLPLTILQAPAGTETLVLEMAMRGLGQIAELAEIAEPDIGCVVNVGPVHLELLGTVERVAEAKAELIAALPAGATAVVPADEPLLLPYLRDDLTTVTFGAGGDVRLLGKDDDRVLQIATPDGDVTLRPSFSEPYLVSNLLAAVACAGAAGVVAEGELEVSFSALRGERLEVLGGVRLINDCYNANPVSMQAALENLGAQQGRRIAVLGGMGELGEDSERFHHEVARRAAENGVDLLVTVGELAGAYGDRYEGRIEHVAGPEAAAFVVRSEATPGDTVLVKGSRSVGLEKVAQILAAADGAEGAR